MNRPRLSFPPAILAAAIQSLWITLAGAQQQPPPTVNIIFEIAAKPFATNLSKQQVEQSERQIGESLAALCSDAFVFLRWNPAQSSASDAGLKVVLRDESRGYNDEIFLDYVAVRGSDLRPLGSDIKTIVYDPTTLTLPSHDAPRLVADVLARLRENFANKDFQKRLHERFVCTVPLAQNIQFDPLTHRCVLPLRWDALQAAEGSDLLASFQARPPNETLARPVQIHMAPERWEGDLKCRVFRLHYPPTKPLDETEVTDSKISESLRDKVANTPVYMEKFERDYRVNTSGSLSVTP